MKSTMKFFTLLSIVISLSIFSKKANAHCEIPCGIYEDSLRIELIFEHLTTIEKSMNMIIQLSAEENVNYNQIVRWVVNKEEHAKKIQDIVSQYFLHQRIKPVDADNEALYKKYIKHLTLLHELLVNAMKTKQTTDVQIVEKMRKITQDFSNAYFHKH